MSGHPSAAGRAQDRESSPVKDQRSTTVQRNQPVGATFTDWRAVRLYSCEYTTKHGLQLLAKVRYVNFKTFSDQVRSDSQLTEFTHLTHFAQSSKMGTVTKGIRCQAGKPTFFKFLTFGHSGAQH